jgi:hypothetical protein
MAINAVRAAIWGGIQMLPKVLDANPLSQAVLALGEQFCVFRVPFLEANAASMAASVGFAEDQFKCILGFLLAYPLALVFSKLPKGNARHSFAGFFGLFLLQFIWGAQWIHSFLALAVSYLLCAALPGKHAPYAVMAFNMVYVATMHTYNMSSDYMGWRVDASGPQMVLTIKLTSFAFNYADGGTPAALAQLDAKLAQAEAALASPKKPDARFEKAALRRVKSQRAVALTALPSPLAFLGYCYSFASLAAGPSTEMAHYLQATELTGPLGAYMAKNGGTLPPRYGRVIFVFVQALGLAGLFQWGMANYPVQGIAEPEVLALPWHLRAGWCWMAMFCSRFKYYFAWKIAEGANILAGFGFGGVDDKTGAPDWSGGENIDIVGFETGTSISGVSRAWNLKTQSWLERYLYARSGGSLVCTYVVSAFWHGVYPGYYLFFLGFATATAAQRKLKAFLEPYAKTLPAPLWTGLCMATTSLVANYLACAFQLLDLDRTIALWRSFYFLPHVGLLIALFVLPKQARAKPAAKKE